MTEQTKCPTCRGLSYVVVSEYGVQNIKDCSNCHGTGRISGLGSSPSKATKEEGEPEPETLAQVFDDNNMPNSASLVRDLGKMKEPPMTSTDDRFEDKLVPFDKLQAALDLFDKVEVGYWDGDPRAHEIDNGYGITVLRVTKVTPQHNAKGENILNIQTDSQWFNHDIMPIMSKAQVEASKQAAITAAVREFGDKLMDWVEYNKHDMGEMGEFIRVEYVKNGMNMIQDGSYNPTLALPGKEGGKPHDIFGNGEQFGYEPDGPLATPDRDVL